MKTILSNNWVCLGILSIIYIPLGLFWRLDYAVLFYIISSFIFLDDDHGISFCKEGEKLSQDAHVLSAVIQAVVLCIGIFGKLLIYPGELVCK